MPSLRICTCANIDTGEMQAICPFQLGRDLPSELGCPFSVIPQSYADRGLHTHHQEPASKTHSDNFSGLFNAVADKTKNIPSAKRGFYFARRRSA